MISVPVVEAAKKVAASSSIPASRLLALVQTETGGREVETYDGRTPALLPEPVWFYRLLPEGKRDGALKSGLAMASGHPDYSAIAGTSQARVERLAAMVAIDEEAGYGACSFGLPQILGTHGVELGYGSAKGLFDAFRDKGVEEQIDAMIRLVDSMGIRQDLVAGNWEVVAAHYNGPNWRENDYAHKLASADAEWHARLTTGEVDFTPDDGMLQLGDRGEGVESLQRVLCAKGYVVRVDGEFGASTEVQVCGFQKQNGITPDGKVGPETRQKLAESPPRPPGARALATMSSVARTTSIGIKAKWAKLVALGAGGLQVASAGGVSPDGVVAKIQSAVDNANQAKTTYTAAAALLTPVGAAPGGLASVVVGAASSPGSCGGGRRMRGRLGPRSLDPEGPHGRRGVRPHRVR